MLTAAAILAAVDNAVETVKVSEWDGEVGIRVMTGAERDAYVRHVTQPQNAEDPGNATRLVLLTLCDAQGTRLFDSEESLIALSNKSGTVLMQLFFEAQRVNKLRDEDIEEMQGNLSATQS